MIKKIIFLMLTVCVFACSSDDDAGSILTEKGLSIEGNSFGEDSFISVLNDEGHGKQIIYQNGEFSVIRGFFGSRYLDNDLIFSLDESLNLLQTDTVKEEDIHTITNIQEDSNNGYLFCGTKYGDTVPDDFIDSFYLAKYDNSFTKEWSTYLALGSVHFIPTKILKKNQGGYYLLGTQTRWLSPHDLILAEVNELGELEQYQTHQLNNSMHILSSAYVTQNDHLIVATHRWDLIPSITQIDASVAEFDNNLEKVWSYEMEESNTEFKNLYLTPFGNNKFLLTVEKGVDENVDLIFKAFDVGGGIIWEKKYENTKSLSTQDLIRTEAGKILYIGTCFESENADADVFIGQINPDLEGEFDWGNIYGGEQNEYLLDIFEYAPNQFILTGGLKYEDSDDSNLLFLKIDENGDPIN